MEKPPTTPEQPEISEQPPADPVQEADQPANPEPPPLAALFSEPYQHEPDQVHPRTEWKGKPADIVFTERQHGGRRYVDVAVEEERRRPEAGNRRRLPLMRALPGFHIDYEPQGTAPAAEVLGSIPQFSQRIFEEQPYTPDPGPDEYEAP